MNQVGDGWMAQPDHVPLFEDPLHGGITLGKARRLLAERMTVAGGISSLTLRSGTKGKIRDAVRRAMEVLGPTGRFILHPVDALFPDTPWTGVEAAIEAWEGCR